VQTEKLYYKTPYAKTFNAKVLSIAERDNDRWAVILNRTLFYPESGGQPCDSGYINGIPVESVQEDGDVIIHILPHKLLTDAIHGTINWERRFDHMQQHTGQHILSAAFLSQLQANTVGFHLGSDSCQIDLKIDDLRIEQAQEVEHLANLMVCSAALVQIHTLTPDNLGLFPIRKIPAKNFSQLRLVQIGDFDYSLCCGTHVTNTGETGMIKIRSWDKKNNAIRVDFACGFRALQDYDQAKRISRYLSAKLSAPQNEIIPAFDRQLSKMDSLNQQVASLTTDLSHNYALLLQQKAETVSDMKVIVHIMENASASETAALARELMLTPQTTALLAGINPEKTKAHLVFTTNIANGLNMSTRLKEVLPLLDGKGGGNAMTAQGGGNNLAQLESALTIAKKSLLEQLNS
jgi:alanyl-tRNA synthetase